MTFADKLLNYVRAAYPCVAILTAEEMRVAPEILAVAKRYDEMLGDARTISCYTWSAVAGLQQVYPKPLDFPDTGDLYPACASISELEDAVIIMRDVHTQPIDRDPQLLRGLREAIQGGPERGRTVVITGPSFAPHPTIERLVTILDYALPDEEALRGIAAEVAESVEGAEGGVSEDVVRAMGGLTSEEAANALSLSLIEREVFDTDVIHREKIAAVRRGGLLEYVEPDPRGLDAIGGFAELKSWIMKRRRAYSKEAVEFGLPRPRGCLLLGVPGCLSGDTEMVYQRGNRAGGRSISLRDLYLKFNGIPASSRPWEDLTIPTYLHSWHPDGRVFYNRVISVLAAGVKPVLTVGFDDRSFLHLTADHPVAGPEGRFVEAGNLAPGDVVIARGSMRPLGSGGRDLSARPPRAIVNLKHHPHGALKVIEDKYEYTRVARARLVVEAHMNDVQYEEFVDALKHDSSASAQFKFLPPIMEVHHIDEDTMNDVLSNLMVLPKAEHAREHGKRENFNVEYTREVRVVSVEPAGEEMTYDVQMDMPANNFCANGIIVHNTGKSLAAKCVGTALGVPTLRLDIGTLFNSLVGESEARTRQALAMAEAMAPCVLFCDEIDKALGGAGSSNDSGVSMRVLGTILTWMQECEAQVFVVASANRVDALPPELLRKGRWDELWAVDLPDVADRVEILRIHVTQRDRDPEALCLPEAAVAADNFTGSELEAVVNEALFDAFDEGRDLEPGDLLAAVKRTVPLAVTAKEQIDYMRRWAQGRARYVAKPRETIDVETDVGPTAEVVAVAVKINEPPAPADAGDQN